MSETSDDDATETITFDNLTWLPASYEDSLRRLKRGRGVEAPVAVASDLIWRSAPCFPAGFPRIENDGPAYSVIDPPTDTPAPSIADSSTVEDAKAARLARDREDAARFGASFSAIVGLRIPGRVPRKETP